MERYWSQRKVLVPTMRKSRLLSCRPTFDLLLWKPMFLWTFSPLIPLLRVEHLIRLPGPSKSHLLQKFILPPNLKSQNQLIFCPSWFNKLLQSPDNDLQYKVVSIEPNQILLDPNAI